MSLLPPIPGHPPPEPKPKPRPIEPASKSRFSVPLHRMSDPAAGGAMVPAAGRGIAWANGGPRFGDMVWAKVKSHPWWPGHIYSVSLTDDEEVHRGHRDGLVLVAFFGDSSYGWFDPSELVPFEDHFTEKAAQGGSSRSSFAAAVAEAVDEVARRSALALLCPCDNPDAFRPHPSDGNFFLVDVPAFDTDADYQLDQIRAARQRFVPRKALNYLLDAAVTQRDAAEKAARTVPGMEMAALFLAYRRAVFSPIDNTYAQAFGVDPELALAAEQKAAAERAQRGINNTHMLNSSCTVLVTVYLKLMGKQCSYCFYRSSNNYFDVNNGVDLIQIVSISLLVNCWLHFFYQRE
jgi:hypothetical protein